MGLGLVGRTSVGEAEAFHYPDEADPGSAVDGPAPTPSVFRIFRQDVLRDATVFRNWLVDTVEEHFRETRDSGAVGFDQLYDTRDDATTRNVRQMAWIGQVGAGTWPPWLGVPLARLIARQLDMIMIRHRDGTITMHPLGGRGGDDPPYTADDPFDSSDDELPHF